MLKPETKNSWNITIVCQSGGRFRWATDVLRIKLTDINIDTNIDVQNIISDQAVLKVSGR